jgi:alpha-galactosidase
VPEEWRDEYEYAPETQDNPEPPAGYDYGTSKTATRYNAMRDALVAQNRTIQYSLCAWGHAHVERWGNQTGHSWRMWGDIYPAWSGQHNGGWGLMPIVNQAARHWRDSRFWGHNDWDMLEVGNGDLNDEENRSHFALWAALKSPLLIGTPLNDITDTVLSILSTKELIDFNQDPEYSESARPFLIDDDDIPFTTPETTHPPSHWVGTSTKGIHLFLLNANDTEETIEAAFADLPGLTLSDAEYLVHDMWTGEDVGVFSDKVTVSVMAHDTAALRVTTVDGECLMRSSTLTFKLINTQIGQHPDPVWKPSLS